MATTEKSREALERYLEVGFFSVLLLYIMIMLSDIPPGDSGLFATLLLPIIAVLLVYRIATIVFSTIDVSGLARTVLPKMDVLNWATEDSVDPVEKSDALEDETGLPEPKKLGITTAWIVAALVIVYVFGLVVGGFLYIAAFLYFVGEYRVVTSVGIATAYTLSMYAAVELLRFRIWMGIF